MDPYHRVCVPVFLCTQLCTQKKLCKQKKTMYTKKNCVHKKTYVHKKQRKTNIHLFYFLFFLCTQILGLIISHCARKPVFGMGWILDLELLLLISCIARKWNHTKTFFCALSFSPENSISSKTRDFSRTRFVASQRRLQENVFTRANLFGGANLLFPPI